MLQRILLIALVGKIHSASIPWSQRSSSSSSVWYFQVNSNNNNNNNNNDNSNNKNKKFDSGMPGAYFASDRIIAGGGSSSCEEPTNLPQQFMEWFRESTTDPVWLTIVGSSSGQGGQHKQSKKSSPSQTTEKYDALIIEPESCSKNPSTEPDSDMMDRALCPWEWKLNRDENREPKLITEARCLCRRSRGQMAAECVPILREFPVLKRIKCDENGNYQYRRSYETITVGCHSVMPRSSRALPADWVLRSRTDV